MPQFTPEILHTEQILRLGNVKVNVCQYGIRGMYISSAVCSAIGSSTKSLGYQNFTEFGS